jgi:phage terminase large subunit GpA-like protein
MINSTVMKDTVFGMLGRTDPGGGMINFPAWAPDWLYTQLTAETRTVKGWQNLKGKRNEAWDLLYYCVSLCIFEPIRIEKLNWTTPPIWAEDWDKNDLVFDPEKSPAPFARNAPKRYDLAKLGETLA